MNNIQIFQNNQFGQIRVATTDTGEPLFAGVDIAAALGYSNPRDAIARHCKSRGVVKRDTSINGVVQPLTFINEANLYRLVLKSNMPDAEKVQDWVCEDVLPSIRKHGAYMSQQKIEEALSNPDTIILLATQLKDERTKRAQLEADNKAMQPKVLFADAVATSEKSCLVSELAKILNQNGVDIGQNRLFEWLRSNGYLCSKGEYYNQPTQRAMDMGLFEIKKTAINKPDGTVLMSTTTKVTGKGQLYFTNKFLKTSI